MTKYLLKRLLRGVLSIIAVVAIVMILVYSLMNRMSIFTADSFYTHVKSNAKQKYMYQKWEEYGYLDYVPYADYVNELAKNGEMTEEERKKAVNIARKAVDANGNSNDNEVAQKYVKQFTEYYESRGYTVTRLNAKMQSATKVAEGGQQILFAAKDKPIFSRLWNYFTGLFSVDNIHYTEKETELGVENPGLTFTLKDPAYGGKKFAPAIIGNGTRHKYLLYVDNQFPYIHQNLISVRLGSSFTVNMGVDVFDTMVSRQGSYVKRMITYPTGLTEESADDLHTATYVPNSKNLLLSTAERFTDDYTNCSLYKSGMSKMGYSFVIGILASVMAYLLGVPLGILMARRKDKFIDKLGTVYIIFIIAVPSLAYIFLFKAIGGKIGLPTTFLMDSTSKLMFVLPIVSLALPSIASLMKWLRRYMIDQMNSDYVRFARAGGLSEREIFNKHILKNAVIPIVHGIPASILGALTGAIITERVYVVPGAGNLLTEAINMYDNAVIVGVTLFYAVLSVLSVILGDILMAMVDPRISFTTKAR